MSKAFLTGSHVYGTPNSKSDVDLVVLVGDYQEARKLQELLWDEQAEALKHSETFDGSLSIRHQNLNLIVCWEQHVYDVWAQGTNELKARAPVSRDIAVAHFEELRDGGDKDLW